MSVFLILFACVFFNTAASAEEKAMAFWYPFEGASTVEDYALGLSDWNAARAGEQGRVEVRGADLVVAGRPIRLWGLNNEYADCAPSRAVADFRAAFYARQGFNALRQHKYNDGHGWAGIMSEHSLVEFESAALDRFDYFNARLMEAGLYLNLSSNFGVRYRRDDAVRVEAHQDFLDAETKQLKLNFLSLFENKPVSPEWLAGFFMFWAYGPDRFS